MTLAAGGFLFGIGAVGNRGGIDDFWAVISISSLEPDSRDYNRPRMKVYCGMTRFPNITAAYVDFPPVRLLSRNRPTNLIPPVLIGSISSPACVEGRVRGMGPTAGFRWSALSINLRPV